MSGASPPRSRKRVRWVRWVLGACAVAAALAAAGWLATPWYVRTKVLPDLWAQYGLRMTTEGQDLSIAEGADGRTNVGRILERPRVDPEAALPPATLWEEVLVHGGTVE